RRHTRFKCDWSSDVCSSDLPQGDHPQIKRRFDILRGMVKPKTSGVREVVAQGKSLLAQMMSVIYLGDFVSVYLAYLKGIDPTPRSEERRVGKGDRSVRATRG